MTLWQSFPGKVTAHESVYMWIALTRKCILPRLEIIYVEEVGPTTSLELMLCLSPTVLFFPHTITKDGMDEAYTIGTALDVLVSRGGSRLQGLRVEDSISMESIADTLSFQHLQLLHLSGGVSTAFDPPMSGTYQPFPTLKTSSLHIVADSSIQYPLVDLPCSKISLSLWIPKTQGIY